MGLKTHRQLCLAAGVAKAFCCLQLLLPATVLVALMNWYTTGETREILKTLLKHRYTVVCLF